MILSRKNGYVQRRHLIPDVRVVLNKITVPATHQRRSSHSESEDESVSERTERMKELRIILHRIPLSSDSSNIVRPIDGNSSLSSKKSALAKKVSNPKNENEPSVREDSSDDYCSEDENSMKHIVGKGKKRKHEKDLNQLNYEKYQKCDHKRTLLGTCRNKFGHNVLKKGSSYKPVFRDLRVVLHRIPIIENEECEADDFTKEQISEDNKKEIVVVEDINQANPTDSAAWEFTKIKETSSESHVLKEDSKGLSESSILTEPDLFSVETKNIDKYVEGQSSTAPLVELKTVDNCCSGTSQQPDESD